mgnify:CR=1 FL=1
MIRNLGICILLALAWTMVPGCGETAKPGPSPSAGNNPTNTGKDMSTTNVSTSKAGDGDTKKEDTKKEEAKDDKPKRAEAVLAGGCFWCVEAVFEELDGVISAESGYAGGTAETANYEAVCSGTTKHAEVVRIIYDPSKVSFDRLLAIHFATHDPTTLNQQGNDFGPQYRSAIFYASDEEKRAAQAMIDHLNEAKVFPRKIVTTLEPLEKFYMAEPYHQDYVCNNPRNPYVQHVAMEKVDKVRKKFGEELKEKSPIKWAPNE